MKVIVSTDVQDTFSQFVVVDSFKAVRDLQGVTTLIIHKYKETDFDAGVFVTSFHNNDNINQFIYINEHPSPTLLMVLRGVNGQCFEDEFYLDDEEELLSLLEDLGVVDDTGETALAAPAIDVVSSFVKRVSDGDDRVRAPLYLEQVSGAVNELADITQQQELQLHSMGASALEVFNKASTIIKGMDAKRKEIEQQLHDLENAMENSSGSKQSFGNNVMFFSPYRYLGNSKILLIREYSPCRYLTSFCLGYLNHLHYELNKRPKLVFVAQKGKGVSDKYSAYPVISQESAKISSLYDGEIVFTNNPKKEVIRDLLNKPNDIIVVVDRLYGSQDIVNGRVVRVNAVSGRSDIQRYNIKPEETIFSVTGQQVQLFVLPHIKSFPAEVDARYATYSQLMTDSYAKLDKKLGL